MNENGKRRGGLIWHTQGSGKSLTMVMLVKNLIETITNPRVIVVTDRTDLDVQIRDTFAACNIKAGVQSSNFLLLIWLRKLNPKLWTLSQHWCINLINRPILWMMITTYLF